MLRGLMLQFPFGTDFTADEKRLLRALQWLKQRTASTASAARLTLAAMRPSAPDRYVYCLVYAMQSSNDAEESMGSRQRCDAALSAEAVVRLDTVTAASRDWFTAHLGTVVAP